MIMELEIESILSSQPRLEAKDKTALTQEQQDALDKHKVQVRLQNEMYMRDHPEISVMMNSFVRKVLLERPSDIKEFAGGYFTDPSLKEETIKSLGTKKDD